ncbi:MAG: HEPN domain-containing protein [Chloroflexi bacterium]|nr:HEPN domain-containing protein [Chloroflexota bacterium]MBV9602079.1 HEPN domain-containing protein [Chloroflexota bacterium]
MNRAEYRRIARAKLADAQVLLRARRYDAAYYLAGYVVECGLKAWCAPFKSGSVRRRPGC